MQAIILAGGLGTRLREAVPELPKVMAPVGARPFLALLLDSLAQQAIESVVLSVGYRHEAIVGYFGERYGKLSLEYVIEERPLGTGGAIQRALRQISEDAAVVLNGDTLLRVDYRDMLRSHNHSGSQLSIAVKPVADTGRYGRVELCDGRITKFMEKEAAGPGMINTGVYVVGKTLFDRRGLPASFSFERDFLYPLVHELAPNGYPVDGYFVDIGVPGDYRRAVAELSSV